MKIDFVVNNLGAGGGERVLTIIANELALKGYDITIVTLKNKDEIEDAFPLNEKVQRIKLTKKRSRIYSITNLINLFSFYRQKNNRPKVIIGFMTETGLLTTIIGRLFNIKSVVSEHTNHLNVQGHDGFIRKYVYPFANQVVVLTDFDKDYYLKHRSKALTIPNPSSFEIKKYPAKRKKVILALGNLNKYHVKGFDNLIRAVGPVLSEQTEWQLHIYGAIDNKSLEILSSLTVNHGVEEKVVFKGFCTNVADVMSKSEIFVLSSRREGLPMVLIEAMSQGMACVAFDCITGPAEIIEHNINGLLVEDQNIEKLSESIDYLIHDSDLREKLQKVAPSSIDKFGKEAVIDQWERMFNLI
ncbi:MAG: glycosyltransferase family 4 protein [Allomuricauda sp.]